MPNNNRSEEPSFIEKEIAEVDQLVQRVPRGSYVAAVFAIGIMLSLLPDNLTLGPSWTVLAIAVVLIIPYFISVLKKHHLWTRYMALAITGVVTVGMITSVAFLLDALFAHTASASDLFRDAAVLWVSNIIVFSIWYWEIDRGGSYLRHTGQSETPDFLFPQMSTDLPYWSEWLPSFFDYLFLAFNTSTAFSPTDTLVMSRRGKLLMMLQSSISLVIVAVLAARAINIA